MMSPSQLPPRSPTKMADKQKRIFEMRQQQQNQLDPNLMRACVCTRYGRLTEVDVLTTSRRGSHSTYGSNSPNSKLASLSSSSSSSSPNGKLSMSHSMITTDSDASTPTPIFEIRYDIPKPQMENPHHVLIRNLRTTVNQVDCKQRAGNVAGHSKKSPGKNRKTNQIIMDKENSENQHQQQVQEYDEDDQRSNFPLVILGQDFAGIVEAVGKEVTTFKVGDAVFGSTAPRNACSAKYVCAFDYECALKPKQITWDEAAAAPTAFCTAWKGLFDPELGNLTVHPMTEEDNATDGEEEEEEGEPQFQTYVVDKNDEDERPPRVLIVGASGSVGSAAVQLAKQIAKAEVAAICGAKNVEYVKSLGASPVFDYANAGYEIYYQDHEDERFDVIFDCVGGDSYYYKLHPFLNKRTLAKHQKTASTAAILCDTTNPSIYVTCVGPVVHGGSELLTYNSIAATAQRLVPRFVGNYVLPGRWNSRYQMFLSFTTQNGVLDQVQQALASRKVHARVDPNSPLPLEQLGRGHYKVERGHSNGKVVIAVQEE